MPLNAQRRPLMSLMFQLTTVSTPELPSQDNLLRMQVCPPALLWKKPKRELIKNALRTAMHLSKNALLSKKKLAPIYFFVLCCDVLRVVLCYQVLCYILKKCFENLTVDQQPSVRRRFRKR